MTSATTTTAETLATINAFNTAFNSHDVAAIMALMTDDVLFENTSPFPDGTRYEGQTAVARFWTELFTSTPSAHFAAEEIVGAGDRAVVRWRYSWSNPDGGDGHIRGIDLFRVRDGKVAEKLSYVKG
jgi:ketosteroid isomerase-like protein